VSGRTSKIDSSAIPEKVRNLNHLTIYTPKETPDTVILKRKKIYGLNKNVLIGRMLGTIVDNKGRIYIADLDEHCIHVFQPDGQFITNLGRAGKGPGEFDWIKEMIIGSNQLFAYDSELKRINVFSLDSLSFSYTIALRYSNWNKINDLYSHGPAKFYIQNNGTLLVQFNPLVKLRKSKYKKSLSGGHYEKNYFYRMNHKGKIVSNKIFQERAPHWVFMTFHGKPVVGTFSFYNKSLIAVSNNGDIFSARSGHFLVKEYNPNGRYLHAFYYPYKNSPLYKKKWIKKHNFGYPDPELNYVEQTSLPKTWPALHSIRVDDKDRLWISTITDDDDVYQWWVLKESGKLIARFIWPRDEFIMDIKNGYVYTKIYDDQLDHQKITKYRIDIIKPSSAGHTHG
jgi:hypothetical protein